MDGRAKHAQRRLPFRGHCRDEDTAGCRPRSWCQEGLGLQKQQNDVGTLLGKKRGSKKATGGQKRQGSPPDHFNLTSPLHRCQEGSPEAGRDLAKVTLEYDGSTRIHTQDSIS